MHLVSKASIPSPLPFCDGNDSLYRSYVRGTLTGLISVVLISPLWTDAAQDSLVGQTAHKMLKDVNDIAAQMNLLHRFQYINYADPSQNPIGSYGQDNVQRLQATSRKYDPTGVFQRQVPGGFKLGLRY